MAANQPSKSINMSATIPSSILPTHPISSIAAAAFPIFKTPIISAYPALDPASPLTNLAPPSPILNIIISTLTSSALSQQGLSVVEIVSKRDAFNRHLSKGGRLLVQGDMQMGFIEQRNGIGSLYGVKKIIVSCQLERHKMRPILSHKACIDPFQSLENNFNIFEKNLDVLIRRVHLQAIKIENNMTQKPSK